MEDDVAVGSDRRPGIGRDRDPAEDAGPPGDERVGVDAVADPDRTSAAPPRARPRSARGPPGR